MSPINPGARKGLSVVAITHDECRVWNDGLAPNTAPLRVQPKVLTGKKQFHTANDGQSHRGHDVDKFGKEYLESISLSLAGAHEILVITHGTGKSNAFGAFTDHLDSHHVEISKRIIGHLDADLTNLTDPQILAQARDWLQAHAAFLG